MVEFVRHPTITHLEARRSCQENSCYRPHTHDSFSIGIIESGTSVFAGPLSGRVRLTPGDVIVIAAGQVHQCNPDGGSWRYQMIHMEQEWASALAPADHATSLFSGITVLRGSNLHCAARGWSDLIFSGATEQQIETGLQTLMDMLGNAVPKHTVTDVTDLHLLGRISPILDRLREDETNPSLDELCQLVGLTKYQLLRTVKQSTGLTPLAWRQNARIIQARRMLRSGLPIAETANELGFTDQSHFHRVFRAHVAATPGMYQA